MINEEFRCDLKHLPTLDDRLASSCAIGLVRDFNIKWRELEKQGKCDGIGGSEYQRCLIARINSQVTSLTCSEFIDKFCNDLAFDIECEIDDEAYELAWILTQI